jgi:hypothetical protein
LPSRDCGEECGSHPNVATIDGYEAGIQRIPDCSSDVFFADRHILLDAAEKNASVRDLNILDRLFTYTPSRSRSRRGDDDFRLVVDRALSGLFRSDEFRDVYVKWFGEPDNQSLAFFQLSALAE